jgi:hypothetical protein
MMSDAAIAKTGMDDATFEKIKASLDAELDELDAGSRVGVLLGWLLYGEFRRRRLLKPKAVEGAVWEWAAPSYRNRFVCGLDEIADSSFQVGAGK